MSVITNLLAQVTQVKGGGFPPEGVRIDLNGLGVDSYEEGTPPAPEFFPKGGFPKRLAEDAGSKDAAPAKPPASGPSTALSPSPSASPQPASSTTSPAVVPTFWPQYMGHMKTGGAVIETILKKDKTDPPDQISAFLCKMGLPWDEFRNNISAHKLYKYAGSIPVSWAIPIDDKTDPTKDHYEYLVITQVIQEIEVEADGAKAKAKLHYPAIVHLQLDRKNGQFYCKWDTKDIKDDKGKIKPDIKAVVEKKENIDRLKVAMKDAGLATSDEKEVSKRLKLIYQKFEEKVNSIEGSFHYDPKTGLLAHVQKFDVVMSIRNEAVIEKLTLGPALAGMYAVLGVPPAADLKNEGTWRKVPVKLVRGKGSPAVDEDIKVSVKP